MANGTSKHIITVEIDKIQNATTLGTSKKLFEKELEQAEGYIKYLLRNIRESKENQQNPTNNETSEINEGDNYFHQHNTITVLGPRGGGKTSFMLTLRDQIIKKGKLIIEKGKPEAKIIWLPNLDPTRMEENETFLVTVVANILREINKKYSKGKGDLDHKVREKLESLSRDFAVLAPLQVHEEQWKDLVGDPDSFAYEMLNKAHSGLSLARSFHKFLGVCLDEVFGKAAAFIQPIDDVDTAIKQGWPILETLRRYLATPYLITIISGDIDLYETLVRKQQLDKLTHLLEKDSNTREDIVKIKNQVEQLTEQYLAKVMPSHLRVLLTPIAERIIEKAIEGEDLVKLEFNGDPPTSQLLSKIYIGFSKDLFSYQPTQDSSPLSVLDPSKSLSARLLPHVSRDLVRFFKALEPWCKDKKQPVDTVKIEETLQALIQIFNASLYNGNITPNDLLLLKQGRHLEWLADYCLETRQQVQEFWRLRPRYDDEEWNQRALLLQAFLFQSWKAQEETGEKTKSPKSLLYPHGPMSYGIKVLLPCWIADTRDLIYSRLAEMKRSLNIGNTERHVHMAVRSLAYRLSDDQKNWSSYGLGYVKVGNSIKIHWNDSLGWFGHRVYRPNSGLASYVDVLLALARLVDVLREGFSCGNDEKKLENLFNLFIQDRVKYLHSQPRKISIPIHSKPVIDRPNKKLFKKYMLGWILGMIAIKPEQLLPPPIIARVWVRFMSNLDYIRTDIEFQIVSNDLREESNDLREEILEKIIKCWIKAFLIAILIEEVIFRRGDPKFDISVKQIRLQDDRTFTEILNGLLSDPEFDPDLIYYTKAWISCPLFLEFIIEDIAEKKCTQKKPAINPLFSEAEPWYKIVEYFANCYYM